MSVISVNQVKFVPQWGNVLVSRLAKAGYSTVSFTDLKDIQKLAQIGLKRIQYLYKFMQWYSKYGKYKVETHDNYEVYDRDGVITVNFRVVDKEYDIEIYKTVSKMIKGTVVAGVVCLIYKGNEYAYYFDGMGTTISVRDIVSEVSVSELESGKVSIDDSVSVGRCKSVPKSLLDVLRNSVQITRARSGVRV